MPETLSDRNYLPCPTRNLWFWFHYPVVMALAAMLNWKHVVLEPCHVVPAWRIDELCNFSNTWIHQSYTMLSGTIGWMKIMPFWNDMSLVLEIKLVGQEPLDEWTPCCSGITWFISGADEKRGPLCRKDGFVSFRSSMLFQKSEFPEVAVTDPDTGKMAFPPPSASPVPTWMQYTRLRS